MTGSIVILDGRLFVTFHIRDGRLFFGTSGEDESDDVSEEDEDEGDDEDMTMSLKT